MKKQEIERYEIVSDYNIADRIDKRIEQGYRVVSMIQTKEIKKLSYGACNYIEKDVVLVVYECEV